MTEWVDVKERYPDHRENIKIKIQDIEGKEYELECIFNDYDDYRSWEIKSIDNVIIHAKPTHWMPLPNPPEN